jgi:hypothetical protein
MDIHINGWLAWTAVALAIARTGEQLLHIYKSHQPTQHRVSLLAPVAGAATLVYAHSIGADLALLVATWINTSTSAFAWAMAQASNSENSQISVVEVMEADHE